MAAVRRPRCTRRTRHRTARPRRRHRSAGQASRWRATVGVRGTASSPRRPAAPPRAARTGTRARAAPSCSARRGRLWAGRRGRGRACGETNRRPGVIAAMCTVRARRPISLPRAAACPADQASATAGRNPNSRVRLAVSAGKPFDVAVPVGHDRTHVPVRLPRSAVRSRGRAEGCREPRHRSGTCRSGSVLRCRGAHRRRTKLTLPRQSGGPRKGRVGESLGSSLSASNSKE